MKILEKQKGLKVLITGATSGIGYELARLFSGHGFTLILVSRNKEKLERVKSELENDSGPIHCIAADLSKADAAESVYAQVKALGIEVDVLVNNAGKGLSGENTSLEPSQINELVCLNVNSPTNLCILFSKRMVERKKGFILNVGSFIAYFSLPFFSPYAASKAYLLNYSRSLRTELFPRGVSVTCLLPGFTRTNFDANADIRSDTYKNFSKTIAMNPIAVAKAGIRALFGKKAVCIPGMSNKISFLFSRLVPKGLLSFAAYKLLSGMFIGKQR